MSDIAKTVKQPTSYTLRNWLKNKSTLEFLDVWETVNNPTFNIVESSAIKNMAGSNAFAISAQEWKKRTGAKGLALAAGRYGGTYAHFDITIHFCNWLDASFYVHFIKTFKEL